MHHIFHNGCWYERDGTKRAEPVEVMVNFPAPEELDAKAPAALKAQPNWVARTKDWVVTHLGLRDRTPLA